MKGRLPALCLTDNVKRIKRTGEKNQGRRTKVKKKTRLTTRATEDTEMYEWNILSREEEKEKKNDMAFIGKNNPLRTYI